jgi:hypothetical protein
MLGWDWYGHDKTCAGSGFTEIVFLHPVGTAGHVVHSVASEVRNVDATFHARVGLVRIQQRAHQVKLHQNCVFIRWDL